MKLERAIRILQEIKECCEDHGRYNIAIHLGVKEENSTQGGMFPTGQMTDFDFHRCRGKWEEVLRF